VEIEPFHIAVTDEEIEDLRAALRRTRWPDQVEGVGWDHGADLAYVQDLVAYWADEFDWRAVEARLNEEHHFRARLEAHDDKDAAGAADAIGVHFVHHRGVGPDPLPIVLTHGWPSSFFEFHDVIGPLTDPAAHGGDPADAFDVVVPSLPGYGFSDIPRTPGMTPRRIASLWVELMRGLGYERFGAQGCDWGAVVTGLLGLDHPDHVVGIHLGMVTLAPAARPEPRPEPTEEEQAFVARSKQWTRTEAGYTQIQATKPQTLGYGLTDSPAGLAAWIVEKFRAWSECNGDPESVFTRDDLLTNLSIYWFTRTINSANRLYYESRLAPVRLAPGERVTVPAGFLLERVLPEGHATRNIGAPPRSRAELVYDVRRWTIAARGAHFPAWETPDIYVDDVRTFFRELRAHH
jgi:pimeloyl-ACP methyl ester carboxylesterase